MEVPTLSPEDVDNRITFHAVDQIMEVTFEDITFENSLDVNLFYDRIEQRITESGQDLWFFLVNYCNTRIEPNAWFAFSRRGKDLNLAHSMGSVRFDASEITVRQIQQAGSRENFDPSLFYDRKEALEHLRTLPSRRRHKSVKQEPLSFSRADLIWRIEFIPEKHVVGLDFTDMSFEHSADVDFVYDYIEKQVVPSGRKWFFLINYNGTRIQSPAWVQMSARSKKLHDTWSLGSVRYALGSETETDIRLRAESSGTRPNIRNTVEEAWERIEEFKAAAAIE